jgi:hypothetical protein
MVGGECVNPSGSAGIGRDGVKSAGAIYGADDEGMGDQFAACVADHDDGSA